MHLFTQKKEELIYAAAMLIAKASQMIDEVKGFLPGGTNEKQEETNAERQ